VKQGIGVRCYQIVPSSNPLLEIYLINPWLLGEKCKPIIIRDADGAPWQVRLTSGGQARGNT